MGRIRYRLDDLPVYFAFFNATFRIEPGPDGLPTGYLLDLRSGAIEKDNVRVWSLNPNTSEIKKVDEARYVDLTEAARAHYLRGDGPVFALYGTIDALKEAAKADSRRLSAQEEDQIRSIRSRTFALWEAEFARRATGGALLHVPITARTPADAAGTATENSL